MFWRSEIRLIDWWTLTSWSNQATCLQKGKTTPDFQCAHSWIKQNQKLWCSAANKNPASAVPGGQKVGPDVERLIGQLEQAQDAVDGWAAGVSVPRDDAVLMEDLQIQWVVHNQLD